MQPEIEHADRLIELIRARASLTGGESGRDLVLTAIQDRNLISLVAVRALAVMWHMGSACQALARGVVESAVALDYMEAEGLDDWLTKFWRVQWGAMKTDFEYLAAGGTDLDSPPLNELAAQLGARLAEHGEELLRPNTGEPWHSWSQRVTTEDQIKSLKKSGVYGPNFARSTSELYVLGSRNTHLSPTIVARYLYDGRLYQERDRFDRITGLLHGSYFMSRIAAFVARHRGDQALLDEIDSAIAPLLPSLQEFLDTEEPTGEAAPASPVGS